MESLFNNPITILLGCTAIATVACWIFFYKVGPQKTGFDGADELEKELMKTNKRSRIGTNVVFFLQAAFFVVGASTYSMIKYGVEPKVEEVVFIPPPETSLGEEIDIPETDLPPPPPPPKVVIQVIKPVPDDQKVEKEEDENEEFDEDEEFNDEELEEEEEEEEEPETGGAIKQELKPAPAYYIAGEAQLQATFQALINDKMASYAPGTYVFAVKFTVTANAAIENVSIGFATPNATDDIKQDVIETMGLIQDGWSAAVADGKYIDALVTKKFMLRR